MMKTQISYCKDNAEGIVSKSISSLVFHLSLYLETISTRSSHDTTSSPAAPTPTTKLINPNFLPIAADSPPENYSCRQSTLRENGLVPNDLQQLF